MPLVSLSEILEDARKKRYGVGYFESWNLESTRAVISAANEERSPVMVGFNGTILDERKRDLEYHAAIGKVAVGKAEVPVVLMLNEASGYEQIVKGLRLGFSAVMIDVSNLPYENNVKLTKNVVEAAHAAHASVEGQLDELPHANEGAYSRKVTRTQMTDPKRAREYVNATGIDALSVSVGNVHVMYKQQSEIDFDQIRQIAAMVDVPLAIHGATSIPDHSMKKAIEAGICKINIGTVLRSVFTDGLRKAAGSGYVDPEVILDSGELELKEFVKTKMRVYGSSGKA